MNTRLGLQTITWGDPQHDRIDQILSTAAESGYEGVEIGWRRIAAIGVEKLGRLLKKHRLQLIASHVGGNLANLDQAESERQGLDAVLDGIVHLGAPYLLYSGQKFQSDEQLASDIATLNAAALRCADRGIRLLYHNHDYEFAEDGRVFEALRNQTVTELGFCPDVGWLHKAGMDCVEVLESIRDRVASIHFKDFLTREPGVKDFCNIGDGCVPFATVADWIRDAARGDFWVIAEQDECDGSAEEAVARNARFMETCLG